MEYWSNDTHRANSYLSNFIDEISLQQRTTTSLLGAYVFGNVFHYLYWNNDTSIIKKYWNESITNKLSLNNSNSSNEHQKSSFIPYLLTQMKTKRTLNPHPFGQRSKYVVKPEGVVMAGNHQVHKFVDGKRFQKYSMNTLSIIISLLPFR